MTAWPESLPPLPLLDGYREKPADTVLRTAMDAGPAKLRSRTTAGVANLTLDYVLTRPQTQDLLDFYALTLQGGVLMFDFTHPRTQAMIQCRFRKAPELTAQNGRYMRVGIELEVLP